MLGYESPKGGKNFAFTPSDKFTIAAWIAEHLTVAWTVAVRRMDDKERRAEERGAILRHCPLLNIMHNPKKIAQLRKLRAISQRGGGAS